MVVAELPPHFSGLFLLHLSLVEKRSNKKTKVRNTVTFYRVSENGPAPQTGLILEEVQVGQICLICTFVSSFSWLPVRLRGLTLACR